MFPRIRPLSARLEALLAHGRAASPTIEALAGALERSDVVVHIEDWWWPAAGLVGQTRFVARAGGQRYLRISIDARAHGAGAVALLGHELQHAWEIAQAAWVVDDETMVRLFDRIGHPARHAHGRLRFDTYAGPETARQVTVELSAGRSGVRAGRD